MLYSFVGHPDGFYPTGSLVADKTGHLYGTTTLGGGIAVCRCGAVFELTPPAKPGGTWTETILYSFHGGSNDGKLPYGALAFDKVGNLYGTTQGGGPNNTGTVFKLTPPVTQGGVWTETVLFFFASDGSQGSWPSGKLVFGGPGNLYRTTEGGGANSSCSCGTVFELKPPATQGGAWTESLLYSFGSVAADGLGLEPAPGLILRGGAFYGTTQIGGTNEVGTVFQLLQTNGTWTENILYNFPGGSGGASPLGGLISDSAGNLYGTVRAGGTTNSDCFDGCEAVFELSPPAVTGNPWQETTLYASPAARTVAVRWAAWFATSWAMPTAPPASAG